MIEITVGDCGCSVSQHRASPLTVTMNYCPKHAAADALYEAVQSRLELDRPWMAVDWPRHWTFDHYWRYDRLIVAKMKAALALADGDGGE